MMNEVNKYVWDGSFAVVELCLVVWGFGGVR